jgi:hypothetical protein
VHAPPESRAVQKRQAVIPAGMSVAPDRITQMLLELIILAGLSFSFVGNPALIRMMSIMQPGYKVPHRTTMAVKAAELYTTTLALEKQHFVAHGSKGCSLQVRYCSVRVVRSFFFFFFFLIFRNNSPF